jgi:hypothetical protein
MGIIPSERHPASAKEDTMTRLGSRVFCAMFLMGVAVHGCGGGSSGGGTGGAAVGGAATGGAAVGGAGGSGSGGGLGGVAVVENIIIKDNELTNWVRDPSEPKVAKNNQVAAIATTSNQAVDLIDGGADPFYSASLTPIVFAWQNYMNTIANPPDGYTIKLYVLQMPTAAQATALYDSLVDGSHSYYSTNTWADTTIGDKSRITNSGTDWWINFRKGVYYCEVRLTYAEKTDLVGQKQTSDFAAAVAAKM